MKNLGSRPGCDTDRILNRVAGEPELAGYRVYWLTCPEKVDHVFNTNSAM